MSARVHAYETLILIDPAAEDDRQDEIVGRVRDLVLAAGGTWEAVDPWGRRKLQYEIDKQTEAHFWLLRFTCPGPTVQEADRILRIMDDVLRHKSVLQQRPSRRVQKSAA